MPSLHTRDLAIHYADAGRADAPVLLLLHGWPDDASTWDRVAPALNAAGWRTIIPTLRGFGETRFHDASAPRTANTGILAMDAITLLDGLGVDQFGVAGHDWGSAMAEALALGWPDRVERIAMLSSPSRLGGAPDPSFAQARRFWYHWLQATERGEALVRQDPTGFARIMWDTWSPPGWFDDHTFARVAASFDNPDWVDVTLHSYRSRWGEAEPDPRSRWLEDRIKAARSLDVPNLFIQGEADGVTPPELSEGLAKRFTGSFERVVLPGVGHFPTREAPDAVAKHLTRHFGEGGRPASSP